MKGKNVNPNQVTDPFILKMEDKVKGMQTEQQKAFQIARQHNELGTKYTGAIEFAMGQINERKMELGIPVPGMAPQPQPKPVAVPKPAAPEEDTEDLDDDPEEDF